MYGAQLMAALLVCASDFGAMGASLVHGEGPYRGASPRRTGEDARSHTGSAQLEFFGVGGEKMRAAGCDLVVDAKELSVVGITEILSHLPKIWGLFHKLIAEAGRRRPDLAIVIDSPAFIS